MNHFQWLLSIHEKASGRDLYPLLKEKEQSHDPSFRPFTRNLFRAVGLWPTCSDDHLGEYLPYGYEAGMEGYNFEQDEADRVNMKADIAAVVSGEKDVRDWLVKSGEKAVEVITALHTGQRTYIPSAVVYNGGAITSLPEDVAVEIPIVVEKDTISKIHIGKLPQSVRSLLSLQSGAQQMAVDAAVYGDKQMALQALLADPVINSTKAAESILNELWEINKPYIKSSFKKPYQK
jgi:alpha-galactosidase